MSSTSHPLSSFIKISPPLNDPSLFEAIFSKVAEYGYPNDDWVGTQKFARRIDPLLLQWTPKEIIDTVQYLWINKAFPRTKSVWEARQLELKVKPTRGTRARASKGSSDSGSLNGSARGGVQSSARMAGSGSSVAEEPAGKKDGDFDTAATESAAFGLGEPVENKETSIKDSAATDSSPSGLVVVNKEPASTSETGLESTGEPDVAEKEVTAEPVNINNLDTASITADAEVKPLVIEKDITKNLEVGSATKKLATEAPAKKPISGHLIVQQLLASRKAQSTSTTDSTRAGEPESLNKDTATEKINNTKVDSSNVELKSSATENDVAKVIETDLESSKTVDEVTIEKPKSSVEETKANIVEADMESVKPVEVPVKKATSGHKLVQKLMASRKAQAQPTETKSNGSSEPEVSTKDVALESVDSNKAENLSSSSAALTEKDLPKSTETDSATTKPVVEVPVKKHVSGHKFMEELLAARKAQALQEELDKKAKLAEKEQSLKVKPKSEEVNANDITPNLEDEKEVQALKIKLEEEAKANEIKKKLEESEAFELRRKEEPKTEETKRKLEQSKANELKLKLVMEAKAVQLKKQLEDVAKADTATVKLAEEVKETETKLQAEEKNEDDSMKDKLDEESKSDASDVKLAEVTKEKDTKPDLEEEPKTEEPKDKLDEQSNEDDSNSQHLNASHPLDTSDSRPPNSIFTVNRKTARPELELNEHWAGPLFTPERPQIALADPNNLPPLNTAFRQRDMSENDNVRATSRAPQRQPRNPGPAMPASRYTGRNLPPHLRAIKNSSNSSTEHLPSTLQHHLRKESPPAPLARLEPFVPFRNEGLISLADQTGLLSMEDDLTSFADIAKKEVSSAIMLSADVLAENLNRIPQYALMGSLTKKDVVDPRVFLNSNHPFSAFICGLQGSGKSHSTSVLMENCLLQSKALGQLNKPLASLVMHFSEYTSAESFRPCELAHLATPHVNFPEVRGAPVQVFVSPTNYRNLKAHYAQIPGVSVRRLRIQQKDLTITNLLTLMSVSETKEIPLYMASVNRILRDLAIELPVFDYKEFKKRILALQLSSKQEQPLFMRMDLLESFLDLENNDGPMRFDPGVISIVDLSCPFVDSSTACILFNIMLGSFLSSNPDVGKIIAVDEAHKYITSSPASKVLTNSLISVIRLQRHYGARVIIATQEPTIDTRLIDLCSMTLIHRFTSPEWFAILRKHISVRDEEAMKLFCNIMCLQTGEALAFASSAIIQGKQLGVDVLRLRIRKRITADGGSSVMAVKA